MAAEGGIGNPLALQQPQQRKQETKEVLPPSLQILADSWTITAKGYNSIFVPKFAPWTKDSVKALKDEIVTMIKNDVKKEEDTTSIARKTLVQDVDQYRCCWVPCCGPGEEIATLVEMLIELTSSISSSSLSSQNNLSWSILGTDLAQGMVQIARRRFGMDVNHCSEETRTTAGRGSKIDTSDTDRSTNNGNLKNNKKKIESIMIDVRVGNAMEVPDPIPPSSCQKFSAILCIFGLQQLSKPVEAIKSWVDALDERNGGTLVVCYWPQGKSQKVNTQDEPSDPLNPWSRLREVVQKTMMAAEAVTNKESTSRDVIADTNHGSTDNNGGDPHNLAMQKQGIMDYWEDDLIPVALSIPGTQLIRDSTLSHEIHWQSAMECFDEMTNAGPLHALRLRMGDEFVDSMRDEFCSTYPLDQSLKYIFKARLVVIRRS
jgi:hypothetical protein